jgi:RND family efflux transporter MFP subunit
MIRSNLIRPTLLAAATLTFSIATGCDESADAKSSGTATATTQPAREPLAVRVAPVSRAPFPSLVEFTGTLYGDEESQIASKVAGRIVETRVDLGDRVADGTPLVVVDPTDAQLLVDQRKLALQEALAKVGLTQLPADDFDVAQIATVRKVAVQAENARSRLDRAKQLFESKPQPLISAQDFDDAQTQYAVAQQDLDVATLDARTAIATARSASAALAVAQQALADTTIRAPGTTGTTQPAADRWAVAERRVTVGEYVAPGSIVYRLVSDQPIKVRATIPERFVNLVAKDQPCMLWVDAAAKPVAGKVARVSPAVDVNSRTFTVEIQFANAERTLKPGSFGRGTITVGQRTDVTTIPPEALYSFAGLDKVFALKDGTAAANVVQVVSKNDQRVVVEGDLGGADAVIVNKLTQLANGTSVTAAK